MEPLSRPSPPVAVSAPAISEFVFGGYLVTRPIPRPSWTSAPPLDDQLITASDCLAKFLPDVWALSWTHDSKTRDEWLSAFGIDPSRLDTLVPLVDELFNRKRLLWARFMTEWQTVEVVLEAAAPSTECRVLGLGIHSDLVTSFIKDAGEIQDPESTLVGLLSKRMRVPEGGTPLGFEILGFEPGYTNAHSWICCNLHRDLAERHGAQAGPNGLLTDYRTADQWADEITREQLGEHVLWLPWMLVEYPASVTAE